jgi:hypothetical protein
VSTLQLYPQIRDTSTLTGVLTSDNFLLVGVEGAGASPGTAVTARPYSIALGGDANTLFGATSSLAKLINFLLKRGVAYVIAVASSMTAAPTLPQRQAAWTALEEDPNVRIRLTDSLLQADLAALGISCDNADKIYNKQFMLGGIATPTTQANLTAAAAAVNSKRGLIVGPGVYDETGTLLNGSYAAAWVAARVAMNSDIADDLDLTDLPGSTGIELDTSGMPLIRIHAGGGSPVNDFETLLQAGVSPLQRGQGGGAQITHLRTTWITDSTYDALMTLLIKDQLFIDTRDLLNARNFLRKPNSLSIRQTIAGIVEDYLTERARGNDAWIAPVASPNGGTSFNVSVISAPSARNVQVHAEAIVLRNLQTIDINYVLSIPT